MTTTNQHSQSAGYSVATARAVDRVLVERQRQIEDKGYSSEHDAEHGVGQLLAIAGVRMQVDAHELVEAAAVLIAAIELLDRDAEIVTQLDEDGGPDARE